MSSSIALSDDSGSANKKNAGSKFAIHNYLISSGSDNSGALVYRVNGTFGQHLVKQSHNDSFVVKGGFWQSANTSNDLIFNNGFE
jgi:hypothetical protein